MFSRASVKLRYSEVQACNSAADHTFRLLDEELRGIDHRLNLDRLAETVTLDSSFWGLRFTNLSVS